MTLDRLTRTCPQSSDPRIRVVLNGLAAHSRNLHRTHSETATAHFRSIGNSLIRLRGSAHAALRLDLLIDCCHYLYLTGSALDSIRLAENGIELATRAGRSHYLRRFLSILGVACADIGDRSRGIEVQSQALAVARTLNDRNGQYASWSNLSVVLVDSGLYQEAIACSMRALEQVSMEESEANDQRARGYTNIALAMHRLGDNANAEIFASKAIALSADATSHMTAVVRLTRELNFVMVLAANGKYSDARTHAQFMRGVADRFPSPRTNGTAQLAEGVAEVYLGDPVRGLAIVEEVASFPKGAMIPLYVDSLSLLSRLYADLDRPEDALRVVQELLACSRSVAAESLAKQFRLLGINQKAEPNSLSKNLGEQERAEAVLRATVAEREISRSRQEMLERMAVAADIREDISGEHGYRVGRLSALLAKEIGWDRDACNALDIAARLHDIGKIGIPDKILLDDKTLREAERHFIAFHTLVGAEILATSDIPQVRIAEEIARCHHEWWDGTGYPKGQKGLAIPKGARIAALADAFDAMTHGRPYAKAIPAEAALDHIATLRGRQFDPELTDHFLALVRRLAAGNPDLDAYLGRAARNSPFLKARARIKEMLAQGHDSTSLSASSPPPGTPLN